MYPVFLEFELPVIGEVTFPAYMTMLTVGFFVAILVARRHGEAEGLDGNRIIDLGLLLLVSALVGARLLSVLADGFFMDFVHLCTDPSKVPAYDSLVDYCSAEIPCDHHYLCNLETNTCYPPRDCLAAFKFWQGGLTFYGGVLLAMPLGLWFARRAGLGALRTADIVAPALMLGLFFGRLGCFFNGCCYGDSTSSWLGVELFADRPPVHPTQLYEAAAALVLYVVLRKVVGPRRQGHGQVLGAMIAVYAVVRFLIEFLRADQRGSLGPLSTSQLLSIPLAALGVWLIISAKRRGLATSPGNASEPEPGETDAAHSTDNGSEAS